jgi:hypothetical protein
MQEGLRTAIGSEFYDEVPRLLADYGARLQHALRQAANDPNEARRLEDEAKDLFRWARAAVVSNRAQAQASLSRLDQVAQYRRRSAGEASLRTWRMEV